ncbi:MAG: hypothetical protein NT117_08985 [Gammaproteobacteria bacterium]|nr:hypothetical protein [Gammaproteobacteria bacterium]
MTIPRATATLIPIALMALLAACERPHGPPPPKAETANVAGQAAPSTVALSGTILAPQPDPVAARPASKAAADYASAMGDGRPLENGADPQALRDFRAEQERRDRELLDQDLSEAQLRAREEAWDRERANAALEESEAAPPVAWSDGREPYRLPREDGDWSPSDDVAADELPLEDEVPIDEPLYEDDAEAVLDDGYDPPGAVYRP